jgi:hypothetical protein
MKPLPEEEEEGPSATDLRLRRRLERQKQMNVVVPALENRSEGKARNAKPEQKASPPTMEPPPEEEEEGPSATDLRLRRRLERQKQMNVVVDRGRTLPKRRVLPTRAAKGNTKNQSASTAAGESALPIKKRAVAQISADSPVSPSEGGGRKVGGRRKVHTRPSSVAGVKDRTVRAKFELAGKHISELQYCNTWEEEDDRLLHPKSQHFMVTFDEMVQQPHYSKHNRYKRKNPVLILLTPEDFDEKAFGSKLVSIGKAMMKRSGTGYVCISDPDEYSELVFGKRLKKKQKRK